MVGVVILNYNNAEQTIVCVESIVKFNSAPIRIVVVDNASTDSSASILGEYCSFHPDAFELIPAEKNGGYAQGNNIGLQYLEKFEDVEYVLVLNNDVLFTSDIIPVMQEFLNNHPNAGVVSPLLYCRDGKAIDYNCARTDCSIAEIIWTYILYFTDIFGILSHYAKKRKILLQHPECFGSEHVEIELPSGSCFMISKSLFKNIGWFDPNTFLYYEENILFRKLAAECRHNYMLPTISCIHLGGETTNKVEHSANYMKSSKASGYYYATHYRRLNFCQRMLLCCAHKIFEIMVVVVKTVKHEK